MGYEGCTAKLRMERVILEDSFFDETEYLCKIIAYDEEEETLYLVSEEAELTSYSLDGIYECSIENLEDPKRECYFISRIFQHSLLLSANNTENDLRRNRYEVSTIR